MARYIADAAEPGPPIGPLAHFFGTLATFTLLAMTVTTVLLADLPPMLEDIVSHLLQSRPDLRVVRGSAKPGGLVAAAAGADAQLVIVSCADPADLRTVDHEVAGAASLTVFALNEEGSLGCLHALRCATTRFDDLAGSQLMAALSIVAPEGRA